MCAKYTGVLQNETLFDSIYEEIRKTEIGGYTHTHTQREVTGFLTLNVTSVVNLSRITINSSKSYGETAPFWCLFLSFIKMKPL